MLRGVSESLQASQEMLVVWTPGRLCRWSPRSDRGLNGEPSVRAPSSEQYEKIHGGCFLSLKFALGFQKFIIISMRHMAHVYYGVVKYQLYVLGILTLSDTGLGGYNVLCFSDVFLRV